MSTKTASLKRTTVKDQSGASKLKIGELLSKAGYITATQFEQAKAEQKKTGKRLSHIMLDNGYIEQDTVVQTIYLKPVCGLCDGCQRHFSRSGGVLCG